MKTKKSLNERFTELESDINNLQSKIKEHEEKEKN